MTVEELLNALSEVPGDYVVDMAVDGVIADIGEPIEVTHGTNYVRRRVLLEVKG